MPRPETDEELVHRAQAGDEPALDALLRRHETLARRRARAYFLIGADHDDLVQEAMIGLFQAVRDFDPEAGASFRSFAEVCVARQVVSAVRAATRHKHAALNAYVPLHAPTGDDDRTIGETLPAPALADPAEHVVATEGLHDLRRQVRGLLSDLEVEVLRLQLDGVGYRDIAGRLDRGAKTVDNALQRIRRKVSGHLQALSVA
ncbi:RNA polymerase sporulation-specific sigma factor [Nocardioides ginsengisegetis]|uniref:RNA polymerase sigma factor SigS n=1 Tax=Nocardioides ginsengisegetis TaxID=661491 RepID=A0A7W3IXK3_9ACTN|nr:RNA polymerase sporulation-specific sigma factor [Nocardioides ginsengisegetis]